MRFWLDFPLLLDCLHHSTSYLMLLLPQMELLYSNSYHTMMIPTLSNNEPNKSFLSEFAPYFYQSHGKVMNIPLNLKVSCTPLEPSSLPQKQSSPLWSRNSTPKASVSVLDTQLNGKPGNNHSNFLCLNLMYHKELSHCSQLVMG